MGTVLRSTSAAWARSRRSELGVGHGRLARFVITVPLRRFVRHLPFALAGATRHVLVPPLGLVPHLQDHP